MTRGWACAAGNRWEKRPEKARKGRADATGRRRKEREGRRRSVERRKRTIISPWKGHVGEKRREKESKGETGSFTRRTNRTNSSSPVLLLLALCLRSARLWTACLPVCLRTIIIVLIWHNAPSITCNVRAAVIQVSTPARRQPTPVPARAFGPALLALALALARGPLAGLVW